MQRAANVPAFALSSSQLQLYPFLSPLWLVDSVKKIQFLKNIQSLVTEGEYGYSFDMVTLYL